MLVRAYLRASTTEQDANRTKNVIGFILRFKRATLAAEMIEDENISLEKLMPQQLLCTNSTKIRK